jgi:hypothetical protein
MNVPNFWLGKSFLKQLVYEEFEEKEEGIKVYYSRHHQQLIFEHLLSKEETDKLRQLELNRRQKASYHMHIPKNEENNAIVKTNMFQDILAVRLSIESDNNEGNMYKTGLE